MHLSPEQLCLSIESQNYEKISGMISRMRRLELRCDSGIMDWDIIKILKKHDIQIIITCRSGKISEEEQLHIYIEAIKNKVHFIDIDLDFQTFFNQKLHLQTKKHKVNLIISYHNYKTTPNKSILEQLFYQCYRNGADLVKIVVTPQKINDIEKIVNLYSKGKPVIAFGMGSFGMITRLLSLYLGAPFTYVSADLGLQTAQGQICFQDMQEIMRLLNLNDLLNKNQM